MATKIESAEEFVSSLSEVELLLRESDDSAPGQAREDERRVAVMNKAALLLLTGKFEAFLESAAEDFLFAVNTIGATARHIPERLLEEHSVRAVQAIDQKLNNGDLAGVRLTFTALGKMWSEVEPCADLDVSCKFNYGRHGEDEVIKLFRRFGFDDVFARVPIVEAQELYEGQVPSPIDVKGLLNSLTGIRTTSSTKMRHQS